MKNRIFNYITLAIALMFLAGCSAKDAEIAEPSSIYGVVSDKATGEPVSSAGVSLSPTGAKTVTGSEGQYEFAELEAGDYKINVTKTGYKDLIDWAINVREGKTNKGDVQIEKLPAVLRVTNSNGVDIDTLDIGSSAGVTTANFNIFNDGVVVLEWSIVESSDWITALSETEGTLESGKTQGIIITIDRSKLLAGVNVTKLHISSNAGSGSKEITVIAMDTRPLVSVESATNVSTTTATLNGTILSAGTPMYTERGFVYDTLPTPTLATTQRKISLTSTEGDNYSAGITDLHQGTRYYVRAYAVNTSGTAYSTNEVDFTTQVLLPTLTTQATTNRNVVAGTATFNGTILTVGDPAYTERGFVYATTANPTLDNTKVVVSGTGTGAFNANVTGLTEGSTYHVRAYVTNRNGTVYGEGISFAFIATLPTVSTQAVTNKNIAGGTATFNGTLISVGDPACTERGFVYGTSHNPTVDATKITVSGNTAGAFSANATGISEGATYYVRAYAVNSKGSVYGEEVSLDFNAVMPTVSTQEVTNKNITAGTATFNGTILTVGDPAYTERGFVYGTSHNPTTDATKITVSGSSAGAFSANAGISEGATYYVRAYATNSNGTVYGEEVSLDFNAVMPTVSTQEVTNKNIAAGTATFNGTILTVGDPAYTERGFVYGTSPNPTVDDATKTTVSGSTAGAFSSVVTGLVEGAIYYIRAYATNSKGTVYGNEVVIFDFFTCGVDFPDSRDSKTYPTVLIGTQCWMSKNMNIGTRVAGSDYNTDQTAGIQKICYENDESYCDTYGGLYNWHETINGENSGSIKYVSGSSTMIQGICPDGWHVPSDDEFNRLEGYLGEDAGRKLKSTTFGGTNTSGWSGLLGGCRYFSGGTFHDGGAYGYWWSSSDARTRYLVDGYAAVYRDGHNTFHGLSVRCLQN
ncbi:MAG: carboxypeptidase regulatory-like domain-containing protein [Culturomica sp.]|jgi:uncharacterized protein (TIGR02145 family)|nr:carboxypeptidase regulatory-like domain-containing protein [Culturomica sp.]